MTDQPAQPLTESVLETIRDRDVTDFVTDPDTVSGPMGHEVMQARVDRRALLAEIDRLRAEAIQHAADRDAYVAKTIKRYDTLAEEAARLRAENTALESDRDNLKRQIDWLAEWLIEHTDEPKSSYGAVEAAINAMAGFQRHIDRSAEVWAQNRQDLEKLRAENTAMTERIAAILEQHALVHRNIAWYDTIGELHVTEVPVCGRCVPKNSSFSRREDIPEGPCEIGRALGLGRDGGESHG